MTNGYQINAGFAVSKAKQAVASWTEGLERAKATGDEGHIRFASESLRLCQENLEKVRRDVRDNWTAYL